MVNGPKDAGLDWDAVDWRAAEDEVRRLRQRIFAATRAGDHKRVRSLQKLMLRSRSNTLVSVRQVTQRNAGRFTAGVDGQVALTSQAKAQLVAAIQRSPREVRPVRRVWIPKANGKLMPRGRSFPFAFGIHTRLTGRTSRGERWMAATSCALACEVRATCPSTPAVKRPALRCVTCRTLTSVLDRERSISFCRLRTRLWSPARVAAKIRCRSRRTSSSAARQSTASQSKPASLGPFTTTLPGRVVASNLSLGSNGLASVLFADPPGPRQPPFEAGHPGPYPAGYTTRPPEERSCCAAFPSPFGMPALACWTILFPPRSSAPLTLGLPATAAGRTSTGLPRCPRVRPNRVGRLLDLGAMVSTRQERSVPAGIRHITAASPEPPPQQPSAGDPQSRGINEGSPYSPVRSSSRP